MSNSEFIQSILYYLNSKGVPYLRNVGNENARFGVASEVRQLQHGDYGIPIRNLNRLSTTDQETLLDFLPKGVQANIVSYLSNGELTTEVQVSPSQPKTVVMAYERNQRCSTTTIVVLLLALVGLVWWYFVLFPSASSSSMDVTTVPSEEHAPVSLVVADDTEWPIYYEDNSGQAGGASYPPSLP